MSVTRLGHETANAVPEIPLPEISRFSEDGDLPHTAAAYFFDRLALPDYDHKPAEDTVKPLHERRMVEDTGRVFSYRTRFTDGTAQDSTLILPDELRTKVTVAISLPWMVSARGMMRGLAQQLVDENVAVILFKPSGAPGRIKGDRYGEPCQPQLKIKTSLTAYNQQRALDSILPNHPELSQGRILATGPSKGGPESFGMAVPKYANGRKVEAIDAVAPAPPVRYSTKDSLKLLTIVPPEGLRLIKHLGKRALDPKFWLFDTQTIDLNPDFWRSVARTRKTLFNGNTGALFRATDPDTHIHLDLHGSDEGCMPQSWQAIGGSRPNTSIRNRPGLRHMDIPARLPYAAARIVMAIDESGNGQDFSKVDFERVSEATPKNRPKAIFIRKQPRSKAAA